MTGQGFDTNGWKTAAGSFGSKRGGAVYDSTHTAATVLDGCDGSNNTPAYFFRTTFNISNLERYTKLIGNFELPELKLLIDAVESSKFITKKKSETLIEKIHTMTSPGQVAKLKRNNYVVNRIKPDNEQIYYIIDAINDAINAGKQISFQYYDYTGLKKKVLKNKGEVYKLSPYKLLWCQIMC